MNEMSSIMKANGHVAAEASVPTKQGATEMTATRYAYANEAISQLSAPMPQQPVQPSIRFSVSDTHQGVVSDPISLHKYLFANANPIMGIDPSGRFTIGDVAMTTGINAVLGGIGGGAISGAYTYLKTGSWSAAGHAALVGGAVGLLAGAGLGAATGFLALGTFAAGAGAGAGFAAGGLMFGLPMLGLSIANVMEAQRHGNDIDKAFAWGGLVLSIAAVGLSGASAMGKITFGTQTITVYRVEGMPNARIIIGPQGEVAIQGQKTLFMNFGSQVRAQEFLARRVQQGMPGATIKSFEVPQSFLTEMQQLAVPESMAGFYPGRPIIVDVTKAPNQFGLRADQIEALQRAVIQGSGRN